MGFPVYCRDVSIRKPRTTGSGNIGIPVQYEKLLFFWRYCCRGQGRCCGNIRRQIAGYLSERAGAFNEKITQKSKISNGMSTLDAMGLLR